MSEKQAPESDNITREFYDVYVLNQDGFSYRSSSNLCNTGSNMNFGESAAKDENNVPR